MGNGGGKLPQSTELLIGMDKFRLNEKQTRKIYKVFQRADSDRSGEIDVEEFHDLFREKNSPFLVHLFATMDVNNNGTLSFVEFMHVMANFSLYGDMDVLEFAFRAFDQDGSGVINEQEFERFVKAMALEEGRGAGGTSSLPVAAKKAMAQIDRDGNGEIDFGEFCEMNDRFPNILWPLFRLQYRIQEATLGMQFWNRQRMLLLGLARPRSKWACLCGGQSKVLPRRSHSPPRLAEVLENNLRGAILAHGGPGPDGQRRPSAADLDLKAGMNERGVRAAVEAMGVHGQEKRDLQAALSARRLVPEDEATQRVSRADTYRKKRLDRTLTHSPRRLGDGGGGGGAHAVRGGGAAGEGAAAGRRDGLGARKRPPKLHVATRGRYTASGTLQARPGNKTADASVVRRMQARSKYDWTATSSPKHIRHRLGGSLGQSNTPGSPHTPSPKSARSARSGTSAHSRRSQRSSRKVVNGVRHHRPKRDGSRSQRSGRSSGSGRSKRSGGSGRSGHSTRSPPRRQRGERHREAAAKAVTTPRSPAAAARHFQDDVIFEGAEASDGGERDSVAVSIPVMLRNSMSRVPEESETAMSRISRSTDARESSAAVAAGDAVEAANARAAGRGGRRYSISDDSSSDGERGGELAPAARERPGAAAEAADLPGSVRQGDE